MSIGKQLLLGLSIYAVSAIIIQGILSYFDPSLNETLRIAITSSPILISIVLTQLLINRIKTKRDE
ncbi:hypothetical protein [Rossellomorea aquimaris]|uniref:Uncharacterized protein n=1 Tax=Rossellomorea aquimaris TaxID=189382 RepID=A0A366E7L5_9BACI|nr:hypothetical protein [Rossellomorea aquimaris]RBO98361.1 hypothetical protein DET59_1381 [Rossellomorea aquimaris]